MSPSYTRAERACNTLLGLSALSWAALGILATEDGAALAPVRVAIAALNVAVGVLFLARRPQLSHGGARGILEALPALLIWALAVKLSPPADRWPAYAEGLFLFGAAWTIWSLLSLGGCFAVLPAARGAVQRGPYRWLRHPAYAGELLMLCACVLAHPSFEPLPLALLALAGPGIILRIRAEERVLDAVDEYRAYAQRVNWRLVPGVW